MNQLAVSSYPELTLTLYLTGQLDIWHLYLASALAGVCEAFQFPAYTAAVTLLVPKEHYLRASGMRSVAESASQVIAPLSAGIMLTLIDLRGVLLLDLATFLIALVTLLFIHIPRPSRTTDERTTSGSWWQELSFGFRYIFDRPGLLGLLLIFTGMNLFAALTYYALLPPMILARTGSDPLALASVQSALGIGSIVGGLLLSTVGGPQRRVHAVLIGGGLSFVLGDFLLAVRQSIPVWAGAAFVAAFFIPFVIGANQAIWQAKVAPDVQGRVFSVQGMIRTAAMPLGYLVAGPLADRVFEPAMLPTGPWAETWGWLVGTGPGAGMALLFVGTSILGLGMCLSGYLFRAVRDVEDDLPDHDVQATL